MAHPDDFKNKGPVPLFPVAPKVKSEGPKPFVPISPIPKKTTSTPNRPTVGGKVLFADQAVGGEIVDPFYRDHPLCAKLSQKDIGRVRAIVKAARVEDTKFVLHYADDLRSRFGTLIDGIIKEQTCGKTAQVNEKMQDLLFAMEASKQLTDLVNNPPEIESMWMRWIKQGAYVPTVIEALQQFQTHFDRVDTLVVELDSNTVELIALIDSFDAVFKNNQDNFTLLNLHVIAGRIITHNHYSKTLPEMEKLVDATNIFEGQNLAYFKDSVQRFERKIDELDKIAHSVVLNAPTIRMLQMGSKDKADRIQRISHTVVPSWKQQCALLINALQNTTSHKLTDTLSDPTFQRKKSVIAQMEQSYLAIKAILI